MTLCGRRNRYRTATSSTGGTTSSSQASTPCCVFAGVEVLLETLSSTAKRLIAPVVLAKRANLLEQQCDDQ